MVGPKCQTAIYSKEEKDLKKRDLPMSHIDKITDNMMIELEPNTAYQIKFCIRVEGFWSKSSNFVRCVTLVSLFF